MTITYRDGSLDDIAEIDRVFRTSFCETFAHLYADEDLQSFLVKFSPQAWTEEIRSADYAFRLAEDDGCAVGYVKLGPITLPVEPAGRAWELRQFYILKPWHGSGIAAELMAWAIGEAERRNIGELFLSVFTDNHRAQRFYRRYGFADFGRFHFMVGNHADDEIIMRRPF